MIVSEMMVNIKARLVTLAISPPKEMIESMIESVQSLELSIGQKNSEDREKSIFKC